MTLTATPTSTCGSPVATSRAHAAAPRMLRAQSSMGVQMAMLASMPSGWDAGGITGIAMGRIAGAVVVLWCVFGEVWGMNQRRAGARTREMGVFAVGAAGRECEEEGM
jgi:hypothetical protein